MCVQWNLVITSTRIIVTNRADPPNLIPNYYVSLQSKASLYLQTMNRLVAFTLVEA